MKRTIYTITLQEGWKSPKQHRVYMNGLGLLGISMHSEFISIGDLSELGYKILGIIKNGGKDL